MSLCRYGLNRFGRIVYAANSCGCWSLNGRRDERVLRSHRRAHFSNAARIVVDSESAQISTESDAIPVTDGEIVNDVKAAESSSNSLVIFDKDGTLICFHSMWTPWALSTAQKIETASGLKSMDIAEEVYRLLGFCPSKKRVSPGLLAEATMPVIKGKLTELLVIHGMEISEATEVVESVWENCDTSSADTLKSLYNLKYLFETLKKHQCRIAVCTADSREGTESALKRLNLSDLVDVVVCGDDKGAQPKPSPHNALKICKALGIDPKNTYMVGDTMADMKCIQLMLHKIAVKQINSHKDPEECTVCRGMGRSAELGETIGVLSGVASEEDLEEAADHIVPSVGNLLPIVLAKAKKKAAQNAEKETAKQNVTKAQKFREYLEQKGGPTTPESDLVKKILSEPKMLWNEKIESSWGMTQSRAFSTSASRKTFTKKAMMRRFFAKIPPFEEKKPTHIIVGGGSAGCVLANRLSEDKENRVLLLEAGPSDDWWKWKIHMPAALMYYPSQ